MVRSVTMESCPRGQIRDLCADAAAAAADDGATTFHFGFLIGTRAATSASSAKDGGVVVFVARTPNEEEEDVKSVTSLADLDVAWMLEHAKQMWRLLPAGVDIVGLFVVTEDDVFRSDMGLCHIRAVFRGVADQWRDETGSLCAAAAAAMSAPAEDFLVLHVRTSTGDCVFKSIDVSADAAAAASANLTAVDYKPDSASLRHGWHRLRGSLILDTPVPLNAQKTEELLLNKIRHALQTAVAPQIASASVLIDGRIRHDSELLDPSLAAATSTSKSKKGKRAKSHQHDELEEETDDEDAFKDHEVQFLLHGDPGADCGDDDDSVESCVSSRLRLGGKLSVVAFVPARATVADAVAAVKADALRSLAARCQMHCDSLVGEEPQGTEDEVPVLHEPPRRILVRLPLTSSICVSDYLYPGETPYDAAESIREIFGFDPDIEHVDDELEIVASQKEIERMGAAAGLGAGSASEEAPASAAASLQAAAEDAAFKKAVAEHRCTGPNTEAHPIRSACGAVGILTSLAVAGIGVGLAAYLTLTADAAGSGHDGEE